jgi:hypothetical protein
VTIKRRNASQENAVGKRLGRTGFGFVIAERRATPAPHYKQRLTKEKRQVLQVIAVNHCKKMLFGFLSPRRNYESHIGVARLLAQRTMQGTGNCHFLRKNAPSVLDSLQMSQSSNMWNSVVDDPPTRAGASTA